PSHTPRDLPSFPTRRSSDLIATPCPTRRSGSKSAFRKSAASARYGNLGAKSGDREGRSLSLVLLLDSPDLLLKQRDIARGQCERSEEHTSELQSLRHLVCRL